MTVKLTPSSGGLGALPPNIYNHDFTFIVSGNKYGCPFTSLMSSSANRQFNHRQMEAIGKHANVMNVEFAIFKSLLH
jgi:hypothetical protein